MMIIDKIPLTVQVSGAKKISLNLNIYRNLHYQVSNRIKKRFVSIIRQNCQIEGTVKSFPVELIYTLFRQNKRREDLMNVGAIIDKFVSDALVKLGYLPDDNLDYIKKVSFEDGGIDKINPHAKLKIREL